MRTLFFGAGPIGSVYAHLLHQAGNDVTVLARGARHDWLVDHGLMLRNGLTGEEVTSNVKVVNALNADDNYDLVIVCIRKNRLAPVFETLAASPKLGSILFMGNNALGFESYLKALPAEQLLMGFPGTGGGLIDQVVLYADREKPKSKRRAITIGEVDGQTRKRTQTIQALFEAAEVPVDIAPDIDGWLRYHTALVSPLVGALYLHDCDNYRVAKDRATLRSVVRAAKEGGRVLKALGFGRSQPFEITLFNWTPEFLSMLGVRSLFASKFAEIAFAMHARAAQDEMAELAAEFQQLTAATAIKLQTLMR